MLEFFTTNAHVLLLWLPAFVLAVLLRVITSRFNNQLIFPICMSSLPVYMRVLCSRSCEPFSSFHSDFMMIPAIFYVVVAAAGLDIQTLRQTGWVFDMGGSSESWYKFYSYFSKPPETPGFSIHKLTVCVIQASAKPVSVCFGSQCLLNSPCKFTFSSVYSSIY